jgi:hypothetical protein
MYARKYVQLEARRIASPGERNPWPCLAWMLGRENAGEDIRTFDQICAAGNYHRPANLGFESASQHADRDIARLQRESSASSASSRFREAALKSRRSSSDHESDQSILLFGVNKASRSARADNSAAASGARRRNASTSDTSRGFNCISMVLSPSYVPTANRLLRVIQFVQRHDAAAVRAE